jgi:predicted CopG family antitoxin
MTDMATVTLSITAEAHERLKNLKDQNESFSDVILREVPKKARNAGELFDMLMARPTPACDPKLMAKVRRGRGRTSGRKARG